MAKLTKTLIDNAELREKPYFIWCDDLPGFGARVFPTGKKTFYIDYYNQAGQRKRMSLGGFGKLTVEEARKMARINLGDALKGDDPALERKTRRTSLTVSELCDDYLTAAEKGLIIARGGQPKKPKGIAADRSAIDAHIKPLLGGKLVIDLKGTDIVKYIRDVQVGKTAKTSTPSGKLRGRIRVTGGSGTATRSAATLGAMLSYAVSEGIIEANPTFGVKKPAIQKRERRLTADEYNVLGDVLREYEADTTKPWQGISIMWLLAFTGCRSGEIQNLKWSEIDLDAQVIRLADSKTGKSIRPLGAHAKAIIEKITQEAGSDYVFPAARHNDLPYAGFRGFYRGAFQQAGFNDVTPHVLRHSFASVGADLGFTDSTIGACLGHSGIGITSRYTHRLDSVLVAAADKISAEIAFQMSEGN